MWTPWCEDRPQLRARVLPPDGTVQELDPKSIGEAPVQQEPNVWSDRKIVRAPLPAIRPGTIAETEVVLREVQPLFARGVVKRFGLAQFFPVRTLRLIIDFPAQLPLRYEVRGMEIKPLRTETSGSVRLVFETRPAKLIKLADLELFAPPEIPLFPEVVFSTGESWNAVATGYEAIVEQQMDVEAVRDLARQSVAPAATREEAARQLLTKVQQMVRYTGVEFGNASIVPRPPRETLARRYGDCKDQATLLVAMLRSAGFPAYAALLRAGNSADIPKDLPGVDQFNHAIVCVAGAPALWLDPTANYVPPGQLPMSDQGRLALIASARVAGLVKTPVADYHQNRYSKTVDYFPSDGGRGAVRETLVADGSCGEGLRASFASQNEETMRKGWEDFFVAKYHSKRLTKFEHTRPQDFAAPFRVTFEASDARICTVGDDTLSVSLFPAGLFYRLPYPLLPEISRRAQGSSAAEGAPPKDRKSPLLLREPHVCEQVFRIKPPPDFFPRSLPEDEVKQFGPATLSRRFETSEDAVRATFRLDTGSGTWTAAEVNSLRSALQDLGPDGDLSRWVVPIEFECRGAKQLREGRFKEALEEYQRQARPNPDQPEQRLRYAKALLKAGFGDAARQVAREVVASAPQSARAYAELGRILTHDLIGRPSRPGMDRPAALAAFRKALELDPSDWMLKVDYAIALEYDDAGQRYSLDADLHTAIAQYRAARKLAGSLGSCEVNLAIDLFCVGDYAGVEKLAAETPGYSWRGLLVAAVAARQGADAAEHKARQLATGPDDRRTLLLTASDHLSHNRFYPLSVAVLKMAMSKEADETALRTYLEANSKLRLYEEVEFPRDDPRRVVQEGLVAALAGGKWEERFFESVCLDLFGRRQDGDARRHPHDLCRVDTNGPKKQPSTATGCRRDRTHGFYD